MQDLERTIETLRSLKALGVSITIDGFGAGFSSLARLRRLPIDALKMDLSFVRGATTDPDDASLVTAVIAVAHSLRLKVDRPGGRDGGPGGAPPLAPVRRGARLHLEPAGSRRASASACWSGGAFPSRRRRRPPGRRSSWADASLQAPARAGRASGASAEPSA